MPNPFDLTRVFGVIHNLQEQLKPRGLHLVHNGMKVIVCCGLVLSLFCTPVLAQNPEWFMPSRQTETVEMLRRLFQLPVSEWAAFLRSRADLLDDSFFQKVEERIQWGVETDHYDDAERFKRLCDAARVATGDRQHHFVPPRVQPKTFEILHSETAVENWEFDYITLQEWVAILKSKPKPFYDIQFFAQLESDIDYAVSSRNYDDAMLLGLIADVVLALRGEQGEYRWRVLETLPAGTKTSIPMDVDPISTNQPLTRQNLVEVFDWKPEAP
jgi:hypothetical protein